MARITVAALWDFVADVSLEQYDVRLSNSTGLLREAVARGLVETRSPIVATRCIVQGERKRPVVLTDAGHRFLERPALT